MTNGRFIARALIIWTLLISQYSSVMAFAEQLHHSGSQRSLSTDTNEQHQNDNCASQSLIQHCATSLLTSSFTWRVTTPFSPILEPLATAYLPFTNQHQLIRAPPPHSLIVKHPYIFTPR